MRKHLRSLTIKELQIKNINIPGGWLVSKSLKLGRTVENLKKTEPQEIASRPLVLI